MKINPENLRSSASQKGFTPSKKSDWEVGGKIKLFRMPFQWNLFRKSSSLTGFTLLEVLIALTILSVGLLGLASLTGSVIRTNSLSDDFTTATALAQDKLEDLINLSYTDSNLTDDITTNNNWDGADPSMLSTSAGNFDTGNQENVDSAGTVGAGGKYTRTWNIWDTTTSTKDIAVIVSWTNDYGNTVTISISTIRSDST